MLKEMGAEVTGPVQNACGHGLDCIGLSSDGTRVLVGEAKATRGGRPPSLSGAQSNMTEYVRSRIARALTGSNYSPEAKAFAQRIRDALANGARIEGRVVETRYVGSASQSTRTRPWTDATPRSGARLPATAPAPAPASPSMAPGDWASRFNPRITCYTNGNDQVRCDTTVVSW